jgi:hypothetical protein
MSTPKKLNVVDHPKWAKIVLIADKTFMQRQIGADSILCMEKKQEKKSKENNSLIL